MRRSCINLIARCTISLPSLQTMAAKERKNHVLQQKFYCIHEAPTA
jgi:hypothetical protein